MVVKFMFQSVFGNSRRNPRHFSPRGRGESLELYSILSSDNKRFYVTEIVLPLWFADAIFRRERSNDRKCVCSSQATNHGPYVHSKDVFHYRRFVNRNKALPWFFINALKVCKLIRAHLRVFFVKVR